MESRTNLPVSGAYINRVRYNLDFITTETIFLGETDDNGMLPMDAREYNTIQEVLIIKYDYWRFKGNISTRLYVTPEGWLKVRLHPVRAYPTGTSLQVSIATQDGSQAGSGITVAAGTDTTVALFGFGGQPNSISWHVSGDTPDLDTSGTINNLPVPRFDTLRVNALEY